LLGVATVTTNAVGTAIFSLTTATPVAPGNVLSATATDPLNNTSEFAKAMVANPRIRLFATGAGVGGGPHVKVYNADGSLRFSFFAYDPSFTGGVHVATGDVNGDGVDDIITGAGVNGGPHVKVFDGVTGNLIQSFFAFAPNFLGGINVATGD